MYPSVAVGDGHRFCRVLCSAVVTVMLVRGQDMTYRIFAGSTWTLSDAGTDQIEH